APAPNAALARSRRPGRAGSMRPGRGCDHACSNGARKRAPDDRFHAGQNAVAMPAAALTTPALILIVINAGSGALELVVDDRSIRGVGITRTDGRRVYLGGIGDVPAVFRRGG